MSANKSNTNGALAWAAVSILACAVSTTAVAAPPSIQRVGSVTIATFPDVQPLSAGDPVDYVNARPLPLPIAAGFSEAAAQADLIAALASPAARPTSLPVFVRGSTGDGQARPVYLGKPNRGAIEDEYAPQEFGTTNHVFSTARADGYTGSTNQIYPYRASGKVFFTKPGVSGTFICSASLIKKGVVVTAAHCVSEFGANRFYTNFRFVPGYKNGNAPYGTWAARTVFVLTAYLNGSDPCSVAGVICRDDVAVVVLAPQGSSLPGTNTGWYGYGYNNAGFNPSGQAHITQIGYPACLDNGALMERNDSQGFKSAAHTNNTLLGSLMCGGSSGGPWLVNFGRRPTLTGTTSGSSPQVNTVVGVTGWGSTSTGPKQMGASPFLNTNIQNLVTAACNPNPAHCAD
jgi:V8-like Glu-specific endopeptidase